MVSRIPPSSHQTIAPISLASVQEPHSPLQNEPAFMTLPPVAQLSNVHTVSTGQQSIRYAHWNSRNTIDIGTVNEDVQGITLSGRHTFPSHVLDEALQARQLNPGSNLYLGIPPANPQKYVLVLDDVLSRHAQASGIVIPLNVRPQQDDVQGPEMNIRNRPEKSARAHVMRFLNKATCRCIASRGQHSGRTHEERAAELRNIGEEFQRGLEAVQTRYEERTVRKTQAGGSRRTEAASSSGRQSPKKHEESVASLSYPAMSSPESIQGPNRTVAAGQTPKRLPADSMSQPDSGLSPGSLSGDTIKAGSSTGTGRPDTTTSLEHSTFERLFNSLRGGKIRSREDLELTEMPPRASSSGTSRGVPHLPGFSPTSMDHARYRTLDQPVASSSRSNQKHAEFSYTSQTPGPSPLGSPINWPKVKEELDRARLVSLKKGRYQRTRDALRKQAGLAPRAGEPAPPEATQSSSLQPHQDTLPIILSISEKNKYAIATQALQRAIGTRPGLANEIQQRGWVGLLIHTLQAYDNVVMARENAQPENVVQTLELGMRNSLRELLYLSNTTDVFNFGLYAPPQLDEDLDAFIRLPQFRTLVETVRDVHQRLDRQRLELGNRVDFASSSGDTYADEGNASGSRPL